MGAAVNIRDAVPC